MNPLYNRCLEEESAICLRSICYMIHVPKQVNCDCDYIMPCFVDHANGYCKHKSWRTPCCNAEICGCCRLIDISNNDPCQVCGKKDSHKRCVICDTRLQQLQSKRSEKDWEQSECIVCKLPLCKQCKTYNQEKCFECK